MSLLNSQNMHIDKIQKIRNNKVIKFLVQNICSIDLLSFNDLLYNHRE